MDDIVIRLRNGDHAAMPEAADEIDRLRTRLEMNFAYKMIDGAMTKISVGPDDYMPDGIDCRDETIKQQDEYIKKLEQK